MYYIPQPYVTELDLRLAHIPAGAVYYLRVVIPATQNGEGEREYDYDACLGSVFEYYRQLWQVDYLIVAIAEDTAIAILITDT